MWRWAPTSTLSVDSDISDDERDEPSEGNDEGKGGLHFSETGSLSCLFIGWGMYVAIPIGWDRGLP